jgi:hypothetical protein
MLWGSFVLMLLSGVFYGLGLPEDWARAMFIATVIVWLALGIALIVQGRMETRAFARARTAAVGEGEPDEED